MTIYTNLDYCKSQSETKECDEFKGLFTPQCPPNHKKILRFICSPVCPDGYADNGSFCFKPTVKNNPNNIAINFYDLFM